MTETWDGMIEFTVGAVVSNVAGGGHPHRPRADGTAGRPSIQTSIWDRPHSTSRNGRRPVPGSCNAPLDGLLGRRFRRKADWTSNRAILVEKESCSNAPNGRFPRATEKETWFQRGYALVTSG